MATTASDIVSASLIGKDDMAMVYLSTSPYFDSFEEIIDIRHYDLNKHRTAGLDPALLHLTGISSFAGYLQAPRQQRSHLGGCAQKGPSLSKLDPTS
jgi:hypothetical protein